MAKTNVTLRIDPELKVQASELFSALGLDLSTATGIFYRQALRYHGIPFEIRTDEPNETTYKAIADAQDKQNMNGPYDTVDNLVEALNA